MDFGEALSRVESWVSANAHGVQLSCVRENDRRFDLRFPSGSFFITVPQQAQEEWVWLNT